jgi:hypothetical protein
MIFMKMILTPATTPDAYVDYLQGWQRRYVIALRSAVLEAAPALRECLNWGHLSYSGREQVLIIRAEPARVLLGFFRGKRLLHIEPRMAGNGKYELRTLQLVRDTPLARNTVTQLVKQAAQLDAKLSHSYEL